MEKMRNFQEMEDMEQKAPEALKKMLVSEIDLIRDLMTIVNMFVGEPLKTGVRFLSEFEQIKK